ncbi:unnamed protein product [Pylaiella littoralis]
MRSASRHTRRRPKQWLRVRAATLSFQFAPSSGLTGLSLDEASRKVQAGDVRPSELTEACIKQMERSSWLNCFVTECADSARMEAEAADARQARGGLVGLLDGIPYAAKDNFCTLGVQTTASSAALAGFTPPYDSTPTGRLRQAGSPLIGKTNMDEFGMGSGTLFSEYGRTLNPWSPGATADSPRTREGKEAYFVPGGSSGGSAAAVSSGACFAALGSDTGGSIRQPAAFCGVVGLKPTYGLVSRFGLIAYASSLDTPGVLARSVLDAAMVLDVIVGPDSKDSTCIPAGSRSGGDGFASGLLDAAVAAEGSAWPLEGATVGIPKEFNVEELADAGVREAWEHTARTATALGATVVEVSMPSVPQALAAYAVLASAEASSNLSRYDGLRYGSRAEHAASPGGAAVVAGGGGGGMFRDQGELHAEITRTRTAGFGDEVKRRILTGCFVLCESAYHDYYEFAIEVQKRLRREMRAALSVADVLLAPTTPFPPFASSGAPAAPASLLLNDVLTVPVSLTGVPSISIPVATVPVGAATLTAKTTVRATAATAASSVCDSKGGGGAAVKGRGGARGGVDAVVAAGEDEWCRLPLGMQVIGRPLSEGTMLRVAHVLEGHLDFAAQVPSRVREGRSPRRS